MLQMRVDIIGDSHLSRLREMHFPIEANVYFWSLRGGGIGHLRNSLMHISEDGSRQSVTDVIVIFLGGNDMDTPFADVAEMANRYLELLSFAERVASTVMVMKIWPRPGSRQGTNYWTNVGYFEHLLEKSIGERCCIWGWDRSMTFTIFFAPDGIHC